MLERVEIEEALAQDEQKQNVGLKVGLASSVAAGNTVPIPEAIPNAAEALVRVGLAEPKKPKVGI